MLPCVAVEVELSPWSGRDYRGWFGFGLPSCFGHDASSLAATVCVYLVVPAK